MIAIRVVSRAGEAIAGSPAVSFGDSGGDIGRAVDCTLVLPDPERRISRKHVQVACRDGRHSLRMISTNLMVELDGVPLAPGVEYPLNAGAQIRIGPFVLLAEPGGSPGADPATTSEDSLALFRPGQAGRASVFHDLLHPQEAAPPARAPAAAFATPYALDLEVGDPTGAGQRQAMSADAAQELAAALYAGLGLAGRQPARLAPQQVELIGALLRAAIEGMLGLLASRHIAKRELGASPTVPRTRANNPLKFSIDANTALSHLLK
ncbi:MAG TPA: type VI secretion system-associated FHA domain protein, partial [Albitalea sp.]|nr:type VI secretion system-associated FHA domain protein [Albitalea sp.]